jgi:hypothetical protein
MLIESVNVVMLLFLLGIIIVHALAVRISYH